jgi:hypothetical protein
MRKEKLDIIFPSIGSKEWVGGLNYLLTILFGIKKSLNQSAKLYHYGGSDFKFDEELKINHFFQKNDLFPNIKRFSKDWILYSLLTKRLSLLKYNPFLFGVILNLLTPFNSYLIFSLNSNNNL